MKKFLKIQKKFSDLPDYVRKEFVKNYIIIGVAAIVSFLALTIGFGKFKVALLLFLTLAAVALMYSFRLLKFLRDEVYEFFGEIIEVPKVKFGTKKLSKAFNQYVIIVKTDRGGSLKVHVNENYKGKVGNHVAIYAPMESCYSESDDIAVVISYYFFTITKY